MKNIKKITIIMWLILLCAVSGFTLLHFKSMDVATSNYLHAKKEASQIDQKKRLYGHSSQPPYDMLRISMPLYLTLKQQQEPEKSALEIMCSTSDLGEEGKAIFNEIMRKEIEYFQANFSNIFFYVKDEKTGHVYTNHEELANFNSRIKEVDISNVWYLSYTRDKLGAFTKMETSTAPDYFSYDSLSNNLREILTSNYNAEWQNRVQQYYNNGNEYNSKLLPTKLQYNTMSDVSFIFYIGDTMLSDYIRFNYTDQTHYSFPNIEFFYTNEQRIVFFGIAPLVFLAFLCLPIRKCKASKLFQFFTKKRSLEFFIATAICLFILFVPSDSYSLMYTLTEVLSEWQNVNNIGMYLIEGLFVLLYFVFIFIVFLLIGGYAMVIRNMLHEGIVKTIKSQSFLIRSTKRLYHFIIFFDIRSKNMQSCLLVLGINALFIFLLCIFPPFFIFVIPYSALLLYFLQKFIKHYRKSYIQLEQIIENVVAGEFPSEIEADLGVFEPLKYNLQKLSDGFEEAVANEMHSQHMKTELITNVSHDLKTPLTSIISYIDLLKNNDITEESKQQYIQILSTSAERLKHLIEDLFEVSKVNSGNVTMDKMNVDVVSLIKQVEMECSSLFQKRQLSIRNSFSDEKVTLVLDPQKTYRIFENLLSNAGKYAAQHSRVYVAIENYASFVEITIRNVSENELNVSPDELTERFTRGDTSRNTEGSGLGLAIAKSFVELQDGILSIHIDGDLFKVIIRFSNPLQVEEEIIG